MARLLLSLVTVLLVITIVVNQADGAPGRKKSSSSGGGWFGGGSKNKNKGGSQWGGGSKTNSYGGKKSSKMKTLKKAAVIGVGAYAGYQLGKATARFGHWGHRGGWGYNDWDRWRQEDGMLCRNDQDCSWMDPSMQCEDYELDFSINRGWFGGDYLAIVGECECPYTMYWDNWELQCKTSVFQMLGGVVLAVILALVGSCCCCCLVVGYCIYKRR